MDENKPPVNAAPAKPPAGKPAVPAVKPVPASAPTAPGEQLRGIVRISGKDMKGQAALSNSLSRIRGIGYNMARAAVKVIEKELDIAPSTKVGSLTDNQITSIEEILKNPVKHGIPAYMVNHAKDDDTGTARHLIQTDWDFTVRQDVEKDKTIRTWIGWRHSLGQKVRGQHNRTTGRTGMTVGVLKKAVKAQKEAAAKTAQATPAAPTTKK